MDHSNLSPLAGKLVRALKNNIPQVLTGDKVTVDPVVSEVASFYERIRNAMEYQDQEVVFRSSIERVLRRRLLFETNGLKIAEPLVKELAWAKYFPANSIPKSLIEIIGNKIDLYINLSKEVFKKKTLSRDGVYSFILEILSSEIAFILKPDKDTQILSNFMFHIFKDKIEILDDDNEENKNALIFICIKRALAKEDRGFLRFDLFNQFFGILAKENFEKTVEKFEEGYEKIEENFKHPLNARVYFYIKKQVIPFIILKDIFKEYEGNLSSLLNSEENLEGTLMRICDIHYNDIYKKTITAIIRSVIFLLATKAVFALFIEGTFENIVYHRIAWSSLALNSMLPPFIMFLSIFLVRKPTRENSLKILEKAKSILYDPQVSKIKTKTFRIHSKRTPFVYGIFIVLWILALLFLISRIILILSFFGINPISQAVFIFFMAIVSFLIYQIIESARAYDIEERRQGFRTVLFNFIFMPFIQLGQRITLGFSKVNFLVILFNYLIEAPFKTLFAFLEQWFSFLRTQRETLE